MEGDHHVWRGVSDPYKHVIRQFLVYFQSQILARTGERFNFKNGSIGGLASQHMCTSIKAASMLYAAGCS